MSNRSTQTIVAIVLIIAGAILVLWVLAMWMMPSMMGNMMGDGMMSSMSGCMTLCTLGPLILAAVLMILGVVLLRNDEARNEDKI
jgi:NADH:ubiquinone oxidoreductase subunit 6 (subunit J)